MGMRAARGRHTDTMMAARRGYGGHNSIGSGQGVPFADWIGASWGDVQLAGWRVSGLVAAVRPEMAGLAIERGRD